MIQSSVYVREEGTITRVAFEHCRVLSSPPGFMVSEANSEARSKDAAMIDRATIVFPNPISSAKIPPLDSAGFSRLVPLMIC